MLMSGGTSIRVPIATYFSGYDYNAVIDAQGAVRDPRYLMSIVIRRRSARASG